jgi:hypothetical protein
LRDTKFFGSAVESLRRKGLEGDTGAGSGAPQAKGHEQVSGFTIQDVALSFDDQGFAIAALGGYGH